MPDPSAKPLLKPVSATRAFLALAVLSLIVVLFSGMTVYLNLAGQTLKEARAHSGNITHLLADQTTSFIRNRTHAVKLMAGENTVVAHLLAANQDSLQLSQPVLRRFCDNLGASICYLMNRQGLAVADNRPPENTIVGNNYGFRPYFQQAVTGNSYVFLALGVTTKKRGIYFSTPVYDGSNIIGVAVIKFPPTQIEEYFMGLSGQAALVDGHGIVFAASESEWLYKSLFQLSPVQLNRIVGSRQFGDAAPDSIGLTALPDNFVEAPDGKRLLIEKTPVDGLDGWQLTYLLPPESLAAPEAERKQLYILALITILFLVILYAVARLYGSLKLAVRANENYRSALEQSQGRLERFEEVITEPIFIHDQGVTVDANKCAEQMLGYSHDEFKHLSARDFFTPETLDIALKNARAGSEEPYQACLKTKSGEEIPVIVTGRAVEWNGKQVRAVSYRDIRSLLAVKKKLSASEDRFRQLSDLVAEGIMIYTESRIIDVNHAFCSIIGQRREDLLAMSLSELFSDDILLQIEREKSGDEAFELVMNRQDGTVFPAEISSGSMQFEDGLYQILSVRDISRQKEQEEHILYQAQYDLLTHVPNRFLARDRAEQAMKNTDRHNCKLVLMFIDLDGFKKVNDSLGHDVGDRVLQDAARRFQSCIRSNDTLARHGGDEFLIIMEDMQNPEDAEVIIEKILQAFSAPFRIDNNELIVTTSIGVAVYPDDAPDYTSLLRAADIGMYKAKKDGRNTFHYYTQEMNEIASRQLTLDNNLRSAMERGEFHLVYQPLMCGKKALNPLAGAEVLLRWESETLGSVSPVEFIPLTEQTGQIIPIGRWILEKACRQAKQWVDMGNEDFCLSVNVSPRQFKGNDLLSDLQFALDSSGLSPCNLSIEVTEGLLIQSSPRLNSVLKQISEMGIKLCMDDFGTGYSSLSYLKTFPFNNLKIDRSFIKELPESNDSQILVTATIAMAHELGLSITAEGIETREQLAFFADTPCDLLQGFLFGRPVSAKEFEATYLKQEVSA